MIKKINVLFFFLFFLGNLVFSQELVNAWSKYDEILTINPLSFDVVKLAEINPTEVNMVAYQAMLEKDYSKAAKFYLYIISHDIGDANSYYNLSRCYAFMGQANYASNFLIMAVNAGFNNFTQINEDEAFSSLKQNPQFYAQFQAVLESGKDLGESIYVKAEKLLKCRVLLPDNYQSDIAYPLLIGMHGFGGTTENFSQIWSYLDSHSFIFVIPEGPYNSKPDTYQRRHGYSWDIGVHDLELYKRSDHLSSDFIVNVNHYVKENYKISKSFIIGFSQGGGYAYATGIKNPDEFEGIICFGARLPDYEKYPWFLSEDEIRGGNKLKVYIAHGKEDGNPNKSAVAAKKVLKKYNYDVKLQLFEGGHYVNPQAFESALDWMGIR